MEIHPWLVVTGISLTTALGVCLAFNRAIHDRVRALERELKSIRMEWENAWSLIDSAAKRAARHEKIQATRHEARQGSIADVNDAQHIRAQIVAAARAKRGE